MGLRRPCSQPLSDIASPVLAPEGITSVPFWRRAAVSHEWALTQEPGFYWLPEVGKGRDWGWLNWGSSFVLRGSTSLGMRYGQGGENVRVLWGNNEQIPGCNLWERVGPPCKSHLSLGTPCLHPVCLPPPTRSLQNIDREHCVKWEGVEGF